MQYLAIRDLLCWRTATPYRGGGLMIPRDELAGRTGRRVEGVPTHGADVAAVDVDADRRAVRARVGNGVNVAERRRHSVNLSHLQRVHRAGKERSAAHRRAVLLAPLLAAQYSDEAPDGMIMDRRLLSRQPDEAHHREAPERVAMKEVLAVALGRGRRERAR